MERIENGVVWCGVGNGERMGAAEGERESPLSSKGHRLGLTELAGLIRLGRNLAAARTASDSEAVSRIRYSRRERRCGGGGRHARHTLRARRRPPGVRRRPSRRARPRPHGPGPAFGACGTVLSQTPWHPAACALRPARGCRHGPTRNRLQVVRARLRPASRSAWANTIARRPRRRRAASAHAHRDSDCPP